MTSPMLYISPIPGKCPSPYARFDNAKMSGGTVATGVDTAEECKQLCIDMEDDCAAIDFNNDVPSCFTHATLDLNNFASGESCCTHWRKLKCTKHSSIHGLLSYTLICCMINSLVPIDRLTDV